MPASSHPTPKVSQIPAETAILAPEAGSSGDAGSRGPGAENPGFRSNALLIYETMRQRIAIRHYPPGTWLKEQEIAAEFGVSRTPVRQALQQLETEGLVEIKNGVGVRVTEVDDAALDQIYLLRLELVALIGRAAPKPISAADLAAIRAVGEDLKRMIAAPGKPDIALFSTHCEVFHNLVNKVIGSPAMNMFGGTYRAVDSAFVAHDNTAIPLGRAYQCADGAPVTLGIRPEHVVVGGGTGITAPVDLVEPTGFGTILHLRALGADLKAFTLERKTAQVGETTHVTLPPERLHLFDQSGARIS